MSEPARGTFESGPAKDAKAALRRQLLAVRAQVSLEARTAMGDAIARVLETEVGHLLTASSSVAVYLSVGSEPSTAAIVDALARRRVTAIAPVLLEDGDLDWAVVVGEPEAGRRRTVEPPGARLGVEAVAGVRLVLAPALAVDRDGRRLGRGGGSYDRALTRVGPETLVLAVVDDAEVVDRLPNEPHDRRVDGALTPSGVRYFSTSPSTTGQP
jgi:5-formyltetrahydrofolate cyclo-ligase